LKTSTKKDPKEVRARDLHLPGVGRGGQLATVVERCGRKVSGQNQQLTDPELFQSERTRKQS